MGLFTFFFIDSSISPSVLFYILKQLKSSRERIKELTKKEKTRENIFLLIDFEIVLKKISKNEDFYPFVTCCNRKGCLFLSISYPKLKKGKKKKSVFILSLKLFQKLFATPLKCRKTR